MARSKSGFKSNVERLACDEHGETFDTKYLLDKHMKKYHGKLAAPKKTVVEKPIKPEVYAKNDTVTVKISDKPSFESEVLPQKPEEKSMMESIAKRNIAEGVKTLPTTEASKQTGLTGDGVMTKVESYTEFSGMIIDLGDAFILPQIYEAPYDKWSTEEKSRLQHYGERLERKYPQLHGLLDNYPEIGLGLTLFMAGYERETVGKRKKYERKKKEDDKK